MPRMLLLPLNSYEVNEGPDIRCSGRRWRAWAIMAMRVLFFITLLLLADAQTWQKWPVSGDCQPCECRYKVTRFGRMRTVNCSKRGLGVIPANLPADLMALDLSWNSLDVEQLREHLCKFQSLQLVSLAFADLTTLSDILKECSSMLELNLTGNRLAQVDSKTFMGLKNLRRLLGLEVESVVARDVFKNLTNLKDLDVIFHGETLPKGLFDNLVIQSLNLVVTQASSLPKRVFEFGQKTLNNLQLIGERVTEVHEDLLDGLHVLRKLYLVMPSVQQLPERFFHSQQMKPGDSRTTRRLTNLQEVEISGVHILPAKLFNQLFTLETLQLKEIGSFPQMEFLAGVISLRTLLITGSKLTGIPAGWFKELYSLKTLTLSGLQLEILHDDAFEGLINLSYLDLSGNNLNQITSKILMPLYKVLETLILRGNFLTEISKDYLGELKSLRHLDVGENRLTNVYTNSFMGMTYLSVLYLNNNRLTSLPKDLFRDLLQLEFLSLADNYLVEFPEAVLQLNRSLRSLNLASNQLREVPASQLCKFMYLETVNIMDNYLHCDCPLLDFHQCSNISVEGQCKTPLQYQGMFVRDVEMPKSCAEEVEENLVVNQTLSQLSVTKSDLSESAIQFTQNDTIIRKLFTEELINHSKKKNSSPFNATQVVANDETASARPTPEKLFASTSMQKEKDSLESGKKKNRLSDANEGDDQFLPKPSNTRKHLDETDEKNISLTNTEQAHPQTGDKNTGQMKTAIANVQNSDQTDTQNFDTKGDKNNWQQSQLSNDKKAFSQESSKESTLLKQEQNTETTYNTEQHSQGNINDILKSYSKNPQSSNKEHSEKRTLFSKENTETTQQPNRESTNSIQQPNGENIKITQQPIKEDTETIQQPSSENADGAQQFHGENMGSTQQSTREKSSTNPSSQAENDNTTLSKGIGQDQTQSFIKTEQAESPLGSKQHDPVVTSTNVSEFLSPSFKDNVERNNHYNTISTAASIPFISSSELPHVAEMNKSNEPYESQSSLVPEVEEIGNNQNNNASQTNTAFNFVISALVVLSVFGCAVLIIFFLRRWQQKGSYIIRNQDTQLNNLDSDASEATSILPMDEPKFIV